MSAGAEMRSRVVAALAHEARGALGLFRMGTAAARVAGKTPLFGGLVLGFRLAEPHAGGWWRLTPDGLAAVGVVRSGLREAPASPCVGECGLDDATGWCRGCARTGPEIAAWRTMADAEKRGVLERAAGRRRGASGGGVASGAHGGTPGVGTGFHGAEIGGNGHG